MSKFITLAIGAAEIATGVLLEFVPGGQAVGISLIMAGVSTTIAGIGTLLSKGPLSGIATTVRNPTAPWTIPYGRVRTGGTVVYMHMWGDSDKMLDIVIVVAACICQSVDVVLFDQQRVQIDGGAAPAGVSGGSGTSFTPVQQHVNCSRIRRVNGVVTVNLPSNIPFLIEGDHVDIEEDGAGSLAANALIGTFQVADILSRASGIVFTYLSGGVNCDISGHGHVNTLWADYGRKVYFEWLNGRQTLGQTFKGMAGTPYDGDMGKIVNPDNTHNLGGDSPSLPNPWTNFCSLQNKTAVFLRLHYSDKYFKGGLPQISFLMHGRDEIYDPRDNGVRYTENAALCIADFLNNPTWGFGAAYGTEIPNANLIAAANVCDEPVPLALSTASPPQHEPAYTCNGQFPLTMRRGEILQNLLTSCAGRITYTGGQFIIWPAAWTGNSFAIGSNPGGGVVSLPAFSQIAAGPIRWKPTISRRDLFNGVKGTYISPSNKWMASDFPPYAQDTLHGYGSDANLTADGGERRWKDIQLPFTASAATAQRIAKIELLRLRHFGTGTLSLNMVGYQIASLDNILVDIPYLAWTAKQLEVVDNRFRIEEGGGQPGSGPVLGVELDVQETDSTIYDWSTSEELSPQGYQQPSIPGIGSFHFFAKEKVPGFTVPFPWKPAYIGPLKGDALYPLPLIGGVNKGPASFGMQAQYGIDAQGSATAKLLIKGIAPPSGLSQISTPQISCTVGTSGSLPPGTYIVAASALDTNSPPQLTELSVPVSVTIPAGANNGSMAITVSWPFGGNGGEIYLADSSTEEGYYFQIALNSATTTTTITNFDQSTPGAPDPTFHHLAIAWKEILHGGVWAQQVQAVTATTITIGGAGMTTNQWAGYVLTLLGRLDPTQDLIILNMPVASSTASFIASPPADEFTLTIGPNSHGDQLPNLTTLLGVGDLVEMRNKARFTPTSFYDPNIANSYFPGGATGVEAGHLAMVLTGPDAGDVQTVASMALDTFGNETIVQIAGSWQTKPNDGDIVIIVDALWGPEIHTQRFSSPSRGAIQGILAGPQIVNLAGGTWLFLVRAQNILNDNGLDAFAPVREIYFFGSQGTRTIGTSQTMLKTDRIIDASAIAGSVVYTALPFSQIPNQGLFIQKIDASMHTVQVLLASGDTINGQGSVTLAKQFDWLTFYVSGNG